MDDEAAVEIALLRAALSRIARRWDDNERYRAMGDRGFFRVMAWAMADDAKKALGRRAGSAPEEGG